MPPKISVSMATYNGESYILEQLQSISAQTLRPDELVICDDLSRDRTWQIIDSFSKQCDFPVILHMNQYNVGPARNFDKAISMTSGDIIFLCDQDDIWLKDKIETMSSLLIEHDEFLIAAHDCLFLSGEGEVSSVTLLQNRRRLRGGDASQIHGSCTAIRRELSLIALPIPERALKHYGHDAWLHLVGDLLACRKIVPYVGMYYRRHSTNVTQSDIYDVRRGEIAVNIRYCWDRFLFFMLDPLGHTGALDLRRELLGVVGERLREIQNEIRPELHTRLTARLSAVQSRLSMRIEISKKGRALRLMPAALMLLRGDYTFFSGWKSFVIDIVK